MISQKEDFQTVIRIFLEFRNKGASLSASDLSVLEEWEYHSVQPQFICHVMREMFLECQNKNKPFPKSLGKISKRIDNITKKMKEV